MLRQARLLAVLLVVALCGCAAKPPKWGVEQRLRAPRAMVLAVAPAIDLSGRRDVDPLLQADLVFAQMQQIDGLTVLPVNRVVEVYAALELRRVESAEQAALACDLLGADGLLVPTISLYDPYVPPKLGASLQLLPRPGLFARAGDVDPRALARQASPGPTTAPAAPGMIQAVGLFDAASGSVQQRLAAYAAGRYDPSGAMGRREYEMSMDRYCGFVWHELAGDLLRQVQSAAP